MPPADVAKLKDDLRQRELILARQFAEFENSLLKLKDRLKRTGKKEDALRAEILEKVLEQSKDASISVQFEQMVDMLKNSKLAGIGDLKVLDERSHKLADDLRDILIRMREDPKYSRLRDERLSLEKLIKEIERIIHHEKIVQGQTDRGKTDPKELKNNQAQVTKATGDVAKQIAKKDAEAGEAKNAKGDAKEGGKEGKKGEAKDAARPKKVKPKKTLPKRVHPAMKPRSSKNQGKTPRKISPRRPPKTTPRVGRRTLPAASRAKTPRPSRGPEIRQRQGRRRQQASRGQARPKERRTGLGQERRSIQPAESRRER